MCEILCSINNRISLQSIDFGVKPKSLPKTREKKKRDVIEKLCDSYVNMEKYLQKKLPLDVALLGHLKCFDPRNIKKKSPLTRIGRLAKLFPHQVSTREVCFVKDQFKALKAEIPDKWFKNNDG